MPAHQGVAPIDKQPEHSSLQANGSAGAYASASEGGLAEIPDIYFALDDQGMILNINKAVAAIGFSRQEMIGRALDDWIHPDDRGRIKEAYNEAVAGKKDCSSCQQFRFLPQEGRPRWFEAHSAIRFTGDGAFWMHEGTCRDITARMQERASLENQIRIRTAELLGANEALRKEITERRETEQVLRDREADLQMEKMHLQETNTALKVLLKRRDVDKRELEEQVMYNVMKLILPYLDKLRKNLADDQQVAYVSIIEANLNDITGAFARRLSIEYYGLTPAELKVANFIRQGKRSPEIARLMGLSKRTVEAHRQGVRRKLRILNKKVNLRTFLLAIS
jgi:PAS domain S-box-containing protein